MFAFLKVLVDKVIVIISLVCPPGFRFLLKQQFEKDNNPKKNVNTIPFLKL